MEEKPMESENHLFKILPFGGICPACSHLVTFYDTSEDKKSGRYKCNNCSRDTVWKQVKTTTIEAVIADIKTKGSKNEI